MANGMQLVRFTFNGKKPPGALNLLSNNFAVNFRGYQQGR